MSDSPPRHSWVGALRRDDMTEPMAKFRLDQKVVVITGASSGLGESVARLMAAAGARLVLAARRPEPRGLLAGELRRNGAEVGISRCDVASTKDCEDVARSAVERFGRIDVLVNNAGVGPAGSALK